MIKILLLTKHSYVHGIMDGEVLREAAENGLHGLHPIAIE